MPSMNQGTNTQRGVFALVWAAYAACGWALLLAAIHVYWALGGTMAFPPGMSMAVGSALFMIDLVAIPLSVGAAVFAMTLVYSRGRFFPRKLLLILAWGGSAFLVVHAVPTLIEGGSIVVGLLNKTLSPLDYWDLVIYEPFWLLGGIFFGIAAWFYQRSSRHATSTTDHLVKTE